MVEKNNFSRTDFFRSKHAAIRTFITIATTILFLGSTVITIFLLFNSDNDSAENLQIARNLVLSLLLFELAIFIAYAIWMLIDNRSEINKHVFEVIIKISTSSR